MSVPPSRPSLPSWLLPYASPHPVWDAGPLAGIDHINWTELTHAHGSAIDAPPLLRAALSGVPADRDDAYQLLGETIYHQGTIYQATSAVVPFLLAIIADPRTPDKKYALGLLSAIAGGGPGITEACGKRSREWFASQGYDFDAEVRYEAAYAQQTYDAVLAGMSLYARLYHDPDLLIRGLVTDVVCALPTATAPTVIPLLEAQIDSQTDPIVLANILTRGAELLMRSLPAPIALCDSFANHCRMVADAAGTDQRVRFAAALATLQLQPAAPSEHLIALVLCGIAAPRQILAAREEDLAARTIEIEDLEGSFTMVIDEERIHSKLVIEQAARVFARLPEPARTRALLAALELMGAGDVAHTFGVMILGLAFLGAPLEPVQGLGRPIAGKLSFALVHPPVVGDPIARSYASALAPLIPNALTAQQRQLVLAVVGSNAIWEIPSNLFAAFGLPE